MRKGRKEFPDDVRRLFEAECVSTVDIDICLEKYDFTAKQLKLLADALYEKIVRDGNNFALRRAFCRARIRHGMTLARVSFVTPVTIERLRDIESGDSGLVRPSECRALNELFGLACTAEYPDVLREPSGTGCIVRLRDMAAFNNFNDIETFAAKHGYREFDEDCLPGFSGVVIECLADEIGSCFKGRVFIQVAELMSFSDRGVFLCRTGDGTYRILETGKKEFSTSDGVTYDPETLVWRLPVRQVVFRVNDRSYLL